MELWGSVGAGDIERQRWAGFDIETGKGVEEVLLDGLLSHRLGSFSVDGGFKPDDDGWMVLEFTARPLQVASGLLAEGYRMYNNYEPPPLENVGVEETAGVRTTHLRAIVSNGGDTVFRFNATFDFWIDEEPPTPRILRMTYVADWERDMYTNGVVTGREIAEKSLDVYDIGDGSIAIDAP